MIWAVPVLLGVPLWLCAVGIFTLVLRSRRLRARHGNVPLRVLRPATATQASFLHPLAAAPVVAMSDTHRMELLGLFAPQTSESAS